MTIVTIDRPEVRNAVDGPTADALIERLRSVRGRRRCAGRDPLRRQRHVLCGSRPEGGRVGARARQPTVRGARPSRSDADAPGEADDRGGRGIRGRRRLRARAVVRSEGRDDGREARGSQPAMGRTSDGRRNREAAATDRTGTSTRPDHDRAARRRRRSASHGTGESGGRTRASAGRGCDSCANEIASKPQISLRGDRSLVLRAVGTNRRATHSSTSIDAALPAIVEGKTVAGAGRFDRGAGRHGESAD